MEITFTLTLDEAQIVMAGLGKLPLEASVLVWQKIQEQAQPQIKPPEPAVEPATE